MNLTVVIPLLAEWVRWHWHVILPKQVSCITEVSIQRSREAVVICCEVKTEVELVFLLPTKFFVHVRRRTPWLDKCAIAPEVVTTRCNTHKIEVVVTRHITSHTITKTNFHLVKFLDVRHEVLTLDIPATRDRREHTPLSKNRISLRTEFR